jgi:hypothetical protein
MLSNADVPEDFSALKKKAPVELSGLLYRFSLVTPPPLTKLLQTLTTSHLCEHRCFVYDQPTIDVQVIALY